MKLFENDQIRLRALEPEDLEFLYKWENDTRLWEYGNTLSPFSKFVLHRYLEHASTDIYEARQVRLIIEDKVTGKPAGTVDLYDFEPYHSRAGIGILVDEAFQQQSYATMALELIKQYAFDFLKLHQLYAFIPTDNIRSLHLFRKVGFLETGLLKHWNKRSDGMVDVAVYQLIS
ncbi:MAG: GNAT family N-acetyltransferase [Bacteroidota bacterium]|nr:GNAT family N-acetyltransferase [Bacteroidota bacterium]